MTTVPAPDADPIGRAGTSPAEFGPSVPDYGTETLSAVLPGAAAALGVDTGLPAITVPPTSRVCVVLIDGLGHRLLESVTGGTDSTVGCDTGGTAATGSPRGVPDGAVAPFLASLVRSPRPAGLPSVLRVGCPTTTATSLGSFGTGLPPGQHGLVGYRVRDPDRGVLLNELRWDPYTDPLRWQPWPTVFHRLEAAGVPVIRIGDPEFAGSGLTLAAQRGGRFVGVTGLAARMESAVTALRESRRSLVYVYWGAVDAAGHEHGWRSAEWRSALSDLDTSLAVLAARLPPDTVLLITADHGMVDVAASDRLDLADHPGLRRGIAMLGGEPRLTQLYCRYGVTGDVARRIRDAVADRAWVRTRDEAVEEGWFGTVDDRVADRIGDVLVAARGTFAMVDREVMHPRAMALIGQHGSLTDDEQLVPLTTLQT